MQKTTIDHIFNQFAPEPELAGWAASEVALAIAYYNSTAQHSKTRATLGGYGSHPVLEVS